MATDDRRVTLNIPEEDEAPPWYLPGGTYAFRVDRAELKEGPKADYVELSLETLYTGQRKVVLERWSLAPKAVWRMRRGLKALGLQASGKITLELDKLEGLWLEADVVDDEYKGRVKSVVDDIRPLEAAVPAEWVGQLDALKQKDREAEEASDEPANEEDLPF